MSNMRSSQDNHRGDQAGRHAATAGIAPAKPLGRPCLLLSEPWVRNSRKKRVIKDIGQRKP